MHLPSACFIHPGEELRRPPPRKVKVVRTVPLHLYQKRDYDKPWLKGMAGHHDHDASEAQRRSNAERLELLMTRQLRHAQERQALEALAQGLAAWLQAETQRLGQALPPLTLAATQEARAQLQRWQQTDKAEHLQQDHELQSRLGQLQLTLRRTRRYMVHLPGITELPALWTALEAAEHKHRRRLELAQLVQERLERAASKFSRKMAMRRRWLDTCRGMLTRLDFVRGDLDSIRKAAAAEPAVVDAINAYTERYTGLGELLDTLVRDGHPEAAAMAASYDAMTEDWHELSRIVQEHLEDLDAAHVTARALHNADRAIHFIAGSLTDTTRAAPATTLAEAEHNLFAHQLYVQRIDEEKITIVGELYDCENALAEEAMPPPEEWVACRAQIDRRFAVLEGMLAERESHLRASLHLHQFLQAMRDEAAWLRSQTQLWSELPARESVNAWERRLARLQTLQAEAQVHFSTITRALHRDALELQKTHSAASVVLKRNQQSLSQQWAAFGQLQTSTIVAAHKQRNEAQAQQDLAQARATLSAIEQSLADDQRPENAEQALRLLQQHAKVSEALGSLQTTLLALAEHVDDDIPDSDSDGRSSADPGASPLTLPASPTGRRSTGIPTGRRSAAIPDSPLFILSPPASPPPLPKAARRPSVVNRRPSRDKVTAPPRRGSRASSKTPTPPSSGPVPLVASSQSPARGSRQLPRVPPLSLSPDAPQPTAPSSGNPMARLKRKMRRLLPSLPSTPTASVAEQQAILEQTDTVPSVADVLLAFFSVHARAQRWQGVLRDAELYFRFQQELANLHSFVDAATLRLKQHLEPSASSSLAQTQQQLGAAERIFEDISRHETILAALRTTAARLRGGEQDGRSAGPNTDEQLGPEVALPAVTHAFKEPAEEDMAVLEARWDELTTLQGCTLEALQVRLEQLLFERDIGETLAFIRSKRREARRMAAPAQLTQDAIDAALVRLGDFEQRLQAHEFLSEEEVATDTGLSVTAAALDMRQGASQVGEAWEDLAADLSAFRRALEVAQGLQALRDELARASATTVPQLRSSLESLGSGPFASPAAADTTLGCLRELAADLARESADLARLAEVAQPCLEEAAALAGDGNNNFLPPSADGDAPSSDSSPVAPSAVMGQLLQAIGGLPAPATVLSELVGLEQSCAEKQAAIEAWLAEHAHAAALARIQRQIAEMRTQLEAQATNPRAHERLALARQIDERIAGVEAQAETGLVGEWLTRAREALETFSAAHVEFFSRAMVDEQMERVMASSRLLQLWLDDHLALLRSADVPLYTWAVSETAERASSAISSRSASPFVRRRAERSDSIGSCSSPLVRRTPDRASPRPPSKLPQPSSSPSSRRKLPSSPQSGRRGGASSSPSPLRVPRTTAAVPPPSSSSSSLSSPSHASLTSSKKARAQSPVQQRRSHTRKAPTSPALGSRPQSPLLLTPTPHKLSLSSADFLVREVHSNREGVAQLRAGLDELRQLAEDHSDMRWSDEFAGLVAGAAHEVETVDQGFAQLHEAVGNMRAVVAFSVEQQHFLQDAAHAHGTLAHALAQMRADSADLLEDLSEAALQRHTRVLAFLESRLSTVQPALGPLASAAAKLQDVEAGLHAGPVKQLAAAGMLVGWDEDTDAAAAGQLAVSELEALVTEGREAASSARARLFELESTMKLQKQVQGVQSMLNSAVVQLRLAVQRAERQAVLEPIQTQRELWATTTRTHVEDACQMACQHLERQTAAEDHATSHQRGLLQGLVEAVEQRARAFDLELDSCLAATAEALQVRQMRDELSELEEWLDHRRAGGVSSRTATPSRADCANGTQPEINSEDELRRRMRSASERQAQAEALAASVASMPGAADLRPRMEAVESGMGAVVAGLETAHAQMLAERERAEWQLEADMVLNKLERALALHQEQVSSVGKDEEECERMQRGVNECLGEWADGEGGEGMESLVLRGEELAAGGIEDTAVALLSLHEELVAVLHTRAAALARARKEHRFAALFSHVADDVLQVQRGAAEVIAGSAKARTALSRLRERLHNAQRHWQRQEGSLGPPDLVQSMTDGFAECEQLIERLATAQQQALILQRCERDADECMQRIRAAEASLAGASLPLTVAATDSARSAHQQLQSVLDELEFELPELEERRRAAMASAPLILGPAEQRVTSTIDAAQWTARMDGIEQDMQDRLDGLVRTWAAKATELEQHCRALHISRDLARAEAWLTRMGVACERDLSEGFPATGGRSEAEIRDKERELEALELGIQARRSLISKLGGPDHGDTRDTRL